MFKIVLYCKYYLDDYSSNGDGYEVFLDSILGS